MKKLWARASASALVLAAGAAVVGCTNAAGSSGAAASTAAGSTAIAPPPASPPSQGAGIEAFNGELQVAWDALRPQLIPHLDATLQSKLGGNKYTSSALDLDIVNIRVNQAGLAVAPGLTRIATNGLALRAPRVGTWDLVLDADVRVTLKVGSFTPAIDLPLQIALDDLTMEVGVDIDDSDPTRPVLQQIGQPQVAFNLRLDSTNSLVQQLTGTLTPIANTIAQTAIQVGLTAVLPQMGGLSGMPGPVPGAHGTRWTDSGAATPFLEVALNVDRKQRRDHLPHGILMTTRMDNPTDETWLNAYQDNGIGTDGNVVEYGSGGDAAIWTGHYLASQAFRYAITGDADAEEHVLHAVGGIGKLLDVNGGTGLLARNAAPVTSLIGQAINRKGPFRSAMINGELWVGEQGGNGISRDQYLGVFLGLSLAYEHVPAARAEAARRIEQMLDYFIANKWVVSEDRPAFPNSRGPTFWSGINTMKLAFLHIGHRINPAKCRNWLAVAGPLSETAWLGAWTSTFGYDHYYKFNLGHGAFYSYFRLETDAARWQDLDRAFRITRRYVDEHRNAYFNLVATSIDPSLKASLDPETREATRQFLDRPHREVGPAVVDLSNVTWVTVTTVGYSNANLNVSATTQQMPSEALDIAVRKPTGHFLWQRDPFSPATPGVGNPREETPGIDYVLPYWMGRFYGAF